MTKPFDYHDYPLDGQNAFGALRKYDIHTGVDLFCDVGQEIHAMEDGIVINVIPFTGDHAGSPWWNDTDAVMIKGKSGVILYGEIKTTLKKNDLVKENDIIGKVVRVLKKDKGLPVTMLHLELYDHSITEPVWWFKHGIQPHELKDPKILFQNF